MERTKLKDREIPYYTKGEEIFNMVTHIVGAGLGLAGMVLCIIFAAIHGNAVGVVSSVIFGISLIFLYIMSSLYHGISREKTAKKVFQIFDHCSIFLLIAGTYTPFALCTIREAEPATGWFIFSVIWIFAILGITLNAIDLKKFKIFSMICYIFMGWFAVFKIGLLIERLTIPGFILVLSGGILYTIGAVLYGLGKKKKWIHSVFHIFTVLASVCHILCVILFVA